MGVSELAILGGDAQWLNALGKIIALSGRIPKGVPYAAADSHAWPNVPVAAELIFHAAACIAGDRGLIVLQVWAVIAALLVLACDATRLGASRHISGFILISITLAGATTFFIVRVQLFSVFLFPLLVMLLRADCRRGGGAQLWWVVPLLAIWSNLHGAALVGYAVVACYLLLSKLWVSPWFSLFLLVACSLALCTTPALWKTPSYYKGLVANESARQSIGLWARLSLYSPFDLAFMLILVGLLYGTWLNRPPRWEIVAMAGLTVLAADAARSGVWLLLMAAPVAAAGLSRRGPWRAPRSLKPAYPGPRLLVVTAVSLGCLSILLVYLRKPPLVAADAQLLARAVTLAHGGVLAGDGASGEELAVDGGCLWMVNPLDAFSQHDQRQFLAWLANGDPQLLPYGTRAVIVSKSSLIATRLATSAHFKFLKDSPSFALYQAVNPAPQPLEKSCPEEPQ